MTEFNAMNMRTQDKSQMIIMVGNSLVLSNNIIINKILYSLWLYKIYFFLTAKRFDFHAIYLQRDNLMLTVEFGKLKFSSFQSIQQPVGPDVPGLGSGHI